MYSQVAFNCIESLKKTKMKKYAKIKTETFQTYSKGKVVQNSRIVLEINMDSSFVKEADHV